MKQDIYSLALWRGIKLLWTQKRKKKYRLVNISVHKKWNSRKLFSLRITFFSLGKNYFKHLSNIAIATTRSKEVWVFLTYLFLLTYFSIKTQLLSVPVIAAGLCVARLRTPADRSLFLTLTMLNLNYSLSTFSRI